MSRSGYNDDGYDDAESVLALGRWRAQVANATRGKRGQSFFRSIIEALDAMPEKRLINSPELKTNDEYGVRMYDSLGDANGNVCVLGALAVHRGLPIDIDAEDHDKLGETFDIAYQLAQETMYMNDEYFDTASPETRWTRMREWAEKQVKP